MSPRSGWQSGRFR